jgi:hypothetical protein
MSDKTEKVLHATWRQVWNITLDFEHVSGDHFLTWYQTEVPSLLLRGAKRAEFRVGPSGKVAELGVAIEEGQSEMVWFERA